jgi:hypothetical protein
VAEIGPCDFFHIDYRKSYDPTLVRSDMDWYRHVEHCEEVFDVYEQAIGLGIGEEMLGGAASHCEEVTPKTGPEPTTDGNGGEGQGDDEHRATDLAIVLVGL